VCGLKHQKEKRSTDSFAGMAATVLSRQSVAAFSSAIVPGGGKRRAGMPDHSAARIREPQAPTLRLGPNKAALFDARTQTASIGSRAGA